VPKGSNEVIANLRELIILDTFDLSAIHALVESSIPASTGLEALEMPCIQEQAMVPPQPHPPMPPSNPLKANHVASWEFGLAH
jgi:hypothetical protein